MPQKPVGAAGALAPDANRAVGLRKVVQKLAVASETESSQWRGLKCDSDPLYAIQRQPPRHRYDLDHSKSPDRRKFLEQFSTTGATPVVMDRREKLNRLLKKGTVNWIHRRLCRSNYWKGIAENKAFPWVFEDIALKGDILEIGPGYGVFTAQLQPVARKLTCLEVDPDLAAGLSGRIPGGNLEVLCGDGAAMPFRDDSFDAVVCFTMLHHVPSAELQDRLFSQVVRVLRPGGIFAGMDSPGGKMMRLLHIGDTMVAVSPGTLPRRLMRAGFGYACVDVNKHAFRFRASKPN